MNTNACSVSGGGTMRGRGGPITAAVDGPGGLILAGDHRQRDTPGYEASETVVASNMDAKQ